MKIKNSINETKGITLVALTITIVVLLIIAGIGVYSGTEVIHRAKLEEVKTNMLLIQAKAREYVEEANFKIGIGSEEEKAAKTEEVRKELYENGQKLKKADSIPEELGISDASACYYMTSETKNKWGLEKLENEEEYLIQFDEKNVKVEIYNVEGFDGKYSLTQIEEIEE